MKFLITERQLRLIEDIELKSRANNNFEERLNFYTNKITNKEIIYIPNDIFIKLPENILEIYVNNFLKKQIGLNYDKFKILPKNLKLKYIKNNILNKTLEEILISDLKLVNEKKQKEIGDMIKEKYPFIDYKNFSDFKREYFYFFFYLKNNMEKIIDIDKEINYGDNDLKIKHLINTLKKLNKGLNENKLNLRSRAKNQLDDAIQYYSEKILKGEIMDNEPFPVNVIKNLPKEILQKYVDFYVEKMKYDIGGFLDIMEENGFENEEWVNPVEKIFNFLPNNIKDLYVNEKLKREDWLTIEEFEYINDDLKKEYIKNRSTLFNDEYDILNHNMKKWYIDYKLSDGYKYQNISDMFFNEFSDEQKLKYFNLMKGNKFYPKYEDFTPHQKEYFRNKQLLENKLNLKSRGKKQSEERNMFAKEILNKDILDVKQTEYNILKSEEKKEIIQKFIDFLKKEFEIKVGYGTITHDSDNVHFSYFLEKKDLYYKFYNLEDLFMFSIGILTKTRQGFSDIVQASETPFKTISNLIKLSIEIYLKNESIIKENLNLKSRAKEQRIEKEGYINSILSKPIETITFEEIEKLQSIFYGEKIDNRIMDKIFSYLYIKYLKEENFSVISVRSNYIRIDFYKNDIRHIIDLSMDNFDGIFYLNHWNSKEKVDNYTNFNHTSHKILKDMFDYLENLIKNES